jgi:hypothetical protein
MVEVTIENEILVAHYNKHSMTLEKFMQTYGEEESDLLGRDMEDERATIIRRERIANKLFDRLLGEKIMTPDRAYRVVL